MRASSIALTGYSRVSTVDQDPQLQLDALAAPGCDDIYANKASSLREDRPDFVLCMRQLWEGDTLVVWKLDRFGRSAQHLLSITEDLHLRGIHFHTMAEAIDTGTPAGSLMLTMMAAIAALERDLVVEGTKAGMHAFTHGLSNARVESVNTKLRLLTRIAFGFRSPEALVALAMWASAGCVQTPRSNSRLRHESPPGIASEVCWLFGFRWG